MCQSLDYTGVMREGEEGSHIDYTGVMRGGGGGFSY